MGASHRTQNFTVMAPQMEMAKKIALAAEQHRRDLAVQWLGAELPAWSAPCPIWVEVDQSAPRGVTSFAFRRGQPVDWEMSLSGPIAVILDCVLPHEVMHTVLATHFGRPLPRWAEEGISTMVEHPTALRRHQQSAITLVHRRGNMPIARLFQLEQYPRDPIPFYMQSFSLSYFLVAEGGRRKFVQFLDDGTRTKNWTTALHQHYGHDCLNTLETAWIQWLVPEPQAEALSQRQ